jgi:hypothetical protein
MSDLRKDAQGHVEARYSLREELRDGEREVGMAFDNPLDPAMERLSCSSTEPCGADASIVADTFTVPRSW